MISLHHGYLDAIFPLEILADTKWEAGEAITRFAIGSRTNPEPEGAKATRVEV